MVYTYLSRIINRNIYNDFCKNWLHFKCVGVAFPVTDTWICQSCRKWDFLPPFLFIFFYFHYNYMYTFFCAHVCCYIIETITKNKKWHHTIIPKFIKGPHIHREYKDPGGPYIHGRVPIFTVNMGTRGPHNWGSLYLLDTGTPRGMNLNPRGLFDLWYRKSPVEVTSVGLARARPIISVLKACIRWLQTKHMHEHMHERGTYHCNRAIYSVGTTVL